MRAPQDPSAPVDDRERAELLERAQDRIGIAGYVLGVGGCSSCLALLLAWGGGLVVALLSLLFAGDSSPGFDSVLEREFSRLFWAGLVAFTAFNTLRSISRSRRLRRDRERWLTKILDPSNPLPRNHVRFWLGPSDVFESPDTILEFADALQAAIADGDRDGLAESDPQWDECGGQVWFETRVPFGDATAEPRQLLATCSIEPEEGCCGGGPHEGAPSSATASGDLRLTVEDARRNRSLPERSAALAVVERVRRFLDGSELIVRQEWRFRLPDEA